MTVQKRVSLFAIFIVLCLHGPQHLYLFHHHNSTPENSKQCNEKKLHFDSGSLLDHETDSECTLCKNNLIESCSSPVNGYLYNSPERLLKVTHKLFLPDYHLSNLIPRGPPAA